jgi:hypothetical protein
VQGDWAGEQEFKAAFTLPSTHSVRRQTPEWGCQAGGECHYGDTIPHAISLGRQQKRCLGNLVALKAHFISVPGFARSFVAAGTVAYCLVTHVEGTRYV